MRRVPVLLLLLLALPCRAAPPDVSGIAYVQHTGATVPLDTQWRDEGGQPVTLRALIGAHPAVLILGYFHCPSLCGLTRDDAFNALAHTGLSDVSVIDVSIDPHETAADAAAAKRDERYGLPGAHFLTGTPEGVTALADAVGFRFRWDDALKQFMHPAGMVVLTPAGTVSSYALGIGFPAADLRGALLRARDGAIAAAASPILLLCFHFDPTTGRYTLAVLKLLQLASVLTVLTVAAMLLILHRHGRAA